MKSTRENSIKYIKRVSGVIHKEIELLDIATLEMLIESLNKAHRDLKKNITVGGKS